MSDVKSDLAEDADLTFGLIVRVVNDLMDIEVIGYDVSSAIQNPGSESDPILQSLIR